MSDFPLSYCLGGWDTIKRLADVFEHRRGDCIAARFDVPTAAMREFANTHAGGPCGYPDPEERARFWDAHLAQRASVLDDSVPAVYPTEFDQGLYGGTLGAEVRYLCDPGTGWISSMVPPMFAELAEMRKLPTLESALGHPLFKQFLRQLDIMTAAGRGKFGVSHMILIDAMNFVFELVGATKAYMGMIELPELVREAIEFAFELNVAVHEAFFARVGLLAGGTCSNMVGWARGRVLNESLDPFHMTSVRDFEAWGRGPVERIFARFDGGAIHIHGNGRHLLEAAATLRGLRGIYLGNDRGFADAFSILPDLRRRVGDMPLVVPVKIDAFGSALTAHSLTGGVLYVVSGAPDADAANRLMDRVRAYTL